jgi:hypothetical protein
MLDSLLTMEGKLWKGGVEDVILSHFFGDATLIGLAYESLSALLYELRQIWKFISCFDSVKFSTNIISHCSHIANTSYTCLSSSRSRVLYAISRLAPHLEIHRGCQWTRNMHEILTLQLGQKSNYLATHFWNTQVGFQEGQLAGRF